MSRSCITSIHPLWAVEGGRVTIDGTQLTNGGTELPEVRIGSRPVQVVHASERSVSVIVPPELEGGHTPLQIGGALGETAFIELGVPVATGLHQVDSPAIDRESSLYLTYSGTRGERSPVSVFRVRRDGFREPFVTGITNASPMADCTYPADLRVRSIGWDRTVLTRLSPLISAFRAASRLAQTGLFM